MNYCFDSVELLQLTQRERDEIAHAQQLAETDDLVLRRDADLLHFVDGKANGVLVVRGDHDADALGVRFVVLQDLRRAKRRGKWYQSFEYEDSYC